MRDGEPTKVQATFILSILSAATWMMADGGTVLASKDEDRIPWLDLLPEGLFSWLIILQP